MKKTHLLLVGGLFLFLNGMSQTETIASQDSSPDTLRVGSIIIIKRDGVNENKEDARHRKSMGKNGAKRKISTNWLVVDLGFANHNDKTDYGTSAAQSFVHGTTLAHPAATSDFNVKTSSFNVNLWLFLQRMSLYKQVINLKYGAGIELYKFYYKSDIRYIEAPTPYVERQNVDFKKNKLAFDYVTVPFMLNINPTPGYRKGGINISAGISAGYLYGARNKQKSDISGKEKFAGDFNLERWKFAYIAELGLGPVQLYGSYAITALHQFGVDQYPYAVGIRFSSW